MKRRVEHLITDARRLTGNVVLGADDGISDEVFIRFANDGQEDIHRAIINAHKRAFLTYSTLDATLDQREYDLSSFILYRHAVTLVEYSDTGLEADFQPLDKRQLIETGHKRGLPYSYSLMGTKLIIDPPPSKSVTGAIRVYQNLALPKLDKRRATVLNVTIVGGAVTALTLDITFPGFSATAFTGQDFLTVVSKTGAVNCYGIAYTAVNAVTGVVTLDGNHTLLSGESVTAGDYVCIGYDATTNSTLPDDCEQYIVDYMTWRALKHDSSDDYKAQQEQLVALKGELVVAYGTSDDDVIRIPIINDDFSEYL